jgi:hypothetical protein
MIIVSATRKAAETPTISSEAAFESVCPGLLVLCLAPQAVHRSISSGIAHPHFVQHLCIPFMVIALQNMP